MVNTNMFEFKHPKYYKELKEFGKRGDRGKPTAASPDTDQAISDEASTEATSVRPGPGLKVSSSKRQAASDKDQASSVKHQAFEPTWLIAKRQASSPE